MSCNSVVKVSNLSKCYQIYESPRDRLKQYLLPKVRRLVGLNDRRYYREFWALNNINFEVGQGQTVGILGKNGAGKSTLLQILCGTLSATTGCVEVNGRVAALLELGAGFSPEFTGLENVYFNGNLLGLDKQDIDGKIKDIEKFADIGEFFYQPVKTYSSGMFARLAFAVAVHVEPDVLIVDEALSVGDSWFQHKSIGRMKRLMENGCTVLFVSHSIDSVRAICDHAIWLERGEIKLVGDAAMVTNEYMNEVFIEHNRLTVESKSGPGRKRVPDEGGLSICDQAKERLDGSALLDVESVSVLNSKGDVVEKIRQGEDFSIVVKMSFSQSINDLSVGVVIKDQFGQELTGESVFNSKRRGIDVVAGETTVVRFSSSMRFRGGQSYSVALRVNQVSEWDRSDNVLIYADDLAAVIDVVSDIENPMWFMFKQDFKVHVTHG